MKMNGYYRNILIVKPSSMGDVVHSLPFLNSVKSCFPEAEIHWVIAKGFEGLLEGHPMIDRLIVINKDTWKQLSKAGETLKEVGRLFKKLRKENYDLVIDLQGLLRSGLITMATGSHVRVGFAGAREGGRLFYNRKIETGKDMHAVDRYMRVAEALGCDTENIFFPFPLIKHDLRENRNIKDSEEYIVIVPGARWESKRWPAENFGEIASRLSLKSFVIGGKSDISLAGKVVDLSGGKAVSLAGGTSLVELVEIMRGARFVISNDSGPMHIAAGFKVPVAAVFGPTSPLRTGPYGDNHIILRSDAQCSPCFKKHCGGMKCMNDVTVDIAYKKIRTVFGV